MFFGEWLIYCILALVFYGAVNVLDTFFVEEEIYENANEGIIVGSIFKILGFIIVGGLFFDQFMTVDFLNAVLAILAGLFLSAAFWFYFRAAFVYNDLSLVQIFWNLSVPLIAIIGWFFLDEKFSFINYFGMVLVVLGAGFVSFSKEGVPPTFKKFLLLNIPLIILYSFSETVMKYVEEWGNIDFWASFPYVCLGQVVFGIILLAINYKKIKKDKLYERIIGGNTHLFVFSEFLELGGMFFMMLAIAKTPAVVFYAVMETFMPLVVIMMTGIAGYIMNFLGKSESLKNIYKNNHIAGIKVKILAVIAMAIGIYFMR